MKRILPILLLLAACDSSNEVEQTSGVDPSELMPDLSVQSPAEVRQRIDAAFSGVLTDPLFTNVRATPLRSICGYVDHKDKDGRYQGPRPFLVTPDGLPLVSTSPQIMFEDADDIFPDFYIRWCATPEEMVRISSLVAARRNAAPTTPEPLLPDMIPVEPLPPPPAQPAPVSVPAPKLEEKASAPPAAPTRQSGDADSFFNAVIRKKNEQKAEE